MRNAPFWIVWSPQGTRPPTVQHGTQEAAQREAERLAGAAPDCEFFVCQAVTRSKKITVITQPVGTPDDWIPF